MNNDFMKNDALKRQAEVSAKDRGNELSPMSPPESYNPPSNLKMNYVEFHDSLKQLIDEHSSLKKTLNSFEVILNKIKNNGAASIEYGEEVKTLLENFKSDFRVHNKKEEKYLFTTLAKRFLEIGEHSKTKAPITPINVLEDEHDEASQLIHEIQYIWNRIFKITDPTTIRLFLKDFLIKSFKLIEITRLHIFREDDIVFPLAQKNLTTLELNKIS